MKYSQNSVTKGLKIADLDVTGIEITDLHQFRVALLFLWVEGYRLLVAMFFPRVLTGFDCLNEG